MFDSTVRGFTLIRTLLRKNLESVYEGFTLIELLIVIAVIGILATVTFIAINPGELMARTRDTGRITAVSVLGRGITAFFTTKEGVYPAEASWGQELTDVQAISSFPKGLSYSRNSVVSCGLNSLPSMDPNYCYDLDESGQNGAIVYSRLESTKNVLKCNNPEVPYMAYSTMDGKAGIICEESDPIPWQTGSKNYVN